MTIGPVSNPHEGMDPTAEELRGRWFGMYLGFVVDRNDPDRRGRVRVWAPNVLGGDKTDESAWTDWCESAGNGLDVPPLNSAVWIAFEGGYVMNPIYFPGIVPDGETPPAADGKEVWPAKRDYASTGHGVQISATLPADTAADNPPEYPQNHVLDRLGFRLEMTEPNGESGPRALLRHPSGTTLLIDADGRVQVRSVGGLFLESEGDVTFAMSKGATFRVLYDGGSGMSLSASGFCFQGYQFNVMNRPIKITGDGVLWLRSSNPSSFASRTPPRGRLRSRSSFPSAFRLRRSTRPTASPRSLGYPSSWPRCRS